MTMAHAYIPPEPRYKLSKTRTPGAVLQAGVSAPDLLTSFTRESSPNTSEFSDASRSYYSTGRDGIPRRREPDTDEGDIIEGGRSLRKRFSRTATTLSKRTSMKMPLGLSKSLIFRNGDTEVGQEDDENMSDAARRKAFRDHLAAMSQPSESTFEEDDIYQERVISPIRRRSFFTPGLATRNPTDKLAKPPKPVKKPDTEMDYYYNPKCSPFSPLERIAALDLAGRPETPLARASTPGDLDYGLMGRLQITNGMASPTPSSLSSLPRASIVLRNSVDQSDIAPLALSENHASHTLLQNLLQTGYFRDSWTDDSRKQNEASREVKPANHVGASGLSSAWFPPEEEYDSEYEVPESDPKSATKSQDITTQIANDYMQVLADNPFEQASRSPSAQAVQPTTKPSEVDADLFDDASVKRQSTWETDYILPDVSDPGDDFLKRTSTLLSQIGLPSSSLAEAMLGVDFDYTAISKADSGYSSGSSVISVEKTAMSPRTANAKRLGTVASKVPPIVVKAKRRPTPVAIQTSTTIQTAPFSNSIQSSTETLNTATTTISFFVDSPRVTSPRKLQKSRPRSQPPPSNRCTIQMHLDIDPYITPSIPNELAARMAQRVAEVPPLDHTLPSVDHQRDEKVDFDHPPLSAPLRFPSPHRPGDAPGDQNAKSQEKRPKHRRVRSSHFDGLLGHKREGKSTELLKSTPYLPHPRDKKHSDNDHSTSSLELRGRYSGPSQSNVQLPDRSAATRSKSVGTGLADNDTTALSNVRAMAKRFDVKPLPDPTRLPSSVYDGQSTRMASGTEPDVPDLRQSLSKSTLATQSSASRSVNYMHNGPSSAVPSPLSPTKIRSPANREAWEIKLHKSRSAKNLVGSPDSKVLPPLPLIPKSKDDQASEPSKSRVSSAEKKLPLLPHQRPTVHGNTSPEISHQDDIDPLLAYLQKQTQMEPISPKSQDPSNVWGHETTSRHIRMQSEPPHTPVEEGSSFRSQPQQAAYPLFTEPQYGRPRSVTHSPSQVDRVEDLTRRTFETSDSEKVMQHVQGRYAGGLAYNYTRDHGISSSAGQSGHASTTETKGAQSGFRKSVSMSKGFGLDLTDVPIFIYANEGPFSADGRTEGVTSGGWF